MKMQYSDYRLWVMVTNFKRENSRLDQESNPGLQLYVLTLTSNILPSESFLIFVKVYYWNGPKVVRLHESFLMFHSSYVVILKTYLFK